MQKRKIGRTGLEVTNLSFGSEISTSRSAAMKPRLCWKLTGKPASAFSTPHRGTVTDSVNAALAIFCATSRGLPTSSPPRSGACSRRCADAQWVTMASRIRCPSSRSTTTATTGSCGRSKRLHRLGLDQIDVLYMHDIGRDTHGDENDTLQALAWSGGLKAMTRLREEGVVKAIGLGVNEVEVCLEALKRADLDAPPRCWKHAAREAQAL